MDFLSLLAQSFFSWVSAYGDLSLFYLNFLSRATECLPQRTRMLPSRSSLLYLIFNLIFKFKSWKSFSLIFKSILLSQCNKLFVSFGHAFSSFLFFGSCSVGCMVKKKFWTEILLLTHWYRGVSSVKMEGLTQYDFFKPAKSTHVKEKAEKRAVLASSHDKFSPFNLF